MEHLSPAGLQVINDLARRHGFSPDAVMGMLESVRRGSGSMVQFNHPEFGGSGQWMRGGMVMVADMFNNILKGRIDALCNELSGLAASRPDLFSGGGFPSRSRSAQSPAGEVPGGVSATPAPGVSSGWWPAELRWPASIGAQDGVRYAWFPQARRLAVEVHGQVSVYDTMDHQIRGFSQQQSGMGGGLTFTSQYGVVDVSCLPVVSGGGGSPAGRRAAAAREEDVFAAIEKLAGLRAKGFLSEEEFAAKKAELLGRL